MCIAIYKPEGLYAKYVDLEEAFSSNRDGAGFCFVQDGELVIKKGYFNFEKFWADYKGMVGDKQALIHFRIATSGEKNEFNCHPWPLLNGQAAIIHNGIINCASSNQKSDTGHFTDDILEPLLMRGVPADDPGLVWLIKKSLGFGNKVVYMDKSGKHVIYNENDGGAHWKNGIWYSNRSYESWKNRNYKPEKNRYNPNSGGVKDGETANGYWYDGVFYPYTEEQKSAAEKNKKPGKLHVRGIGWAELGEDGIAFIWDKKKRKTRYFGTHQFVVDPLAVPPQKNWYVRVACQKCSVFSDYPQGMLFEKEKDFLSNKLVPLAALCMHCKEPFPKDAIEKLDKRIAASQEEYEESFKKELEANRKLIEEHNHYQGGE